MHFKENNFNIIRLFAATQVVIAHTYIHLNIESSILQYIIQIIELFPGVPIFFFISGYLISKSYIRNSRLIEYTQNRVLRIYPALWICFIFSIFSIFLVGYLNINDLISLDFFKWLLAQVSFFQFYNPDFMRDFGVGAMNGSLWTIAVELQFYVLVPLIYFLKLNSSIRLLIGIIVFVIINRMFLFYENETIIFKLIKVSFLPWLYMFLIGILFQENFDLLKKLFEKNIKTKALLSLFSYLFLVFIIKYFELDDLGNKISLLSFLPLAIFIFIVAYVPIKHTKLIKENDLSYGVYIYHMPVVNLLIYLQYSENVLYFYMTMLFTFILAYLSWQYIERPVLSLKKHPLNPINKGIKV